MTHSLPRPRLAPGAEAVALVALCLIAIFVGLAAAGWRSSGPLPADGCRLVEGVAGERPGAINPLFAGASGPDADLTRLIFAGLTRLGPNGQVQPDLAQSWVVSADGRDFTFLLRPDARWQDGAPVTADDVLFTARAFSAPGVKGDPATAEVWRRAQVQKLSNDAVLFHFDAPFTPFLAYSTVGLLPEHILGRDTPTQLVNDPFNQHPIGAGPYRLTRLTANEADLQRVPGYPLGTPYIERIRLRFLPDLGAIEAALRSHAIDSGLRPAYTLVYLNLAAAQFQDAAVRRALSLAVDRNALVQQVMDGQATPSDVPLPPGSYTGASDAPPTANVAMAKQLLAAAGWTPGPDGVLRKGEIALSFTLDTTPDTQRLALARNLAQQWAAIGARVTVQTMDATTLLDAVLLPQKFEAVLYGWDPGPDLDPFPAWHSSQRGGGGRNLSGYANSRVDQLLEAAREAPDAAGRAAIYGAFADQFRQDMPAIVLFFPRYLYAAPAKLENVQLGLLASTADRFAAINAGRCTRAATEAAQDRACYAFPRRSFPTRGRDNAPGNIHQRLRDARRLRRGGERGDARCGAGFDDRRCEPRDRAAADRAGGFRHGAGVAVLPAWLRPPRRRRSGCRHRPRCHRAPWPAWLRRGAGQWLSLGVRAGRGARADGRTARPTVRTARLPAAGGIRGARDREPSDCARRTQRHLPRPRRFRPGGGAPGGGLPLRRDRPAAGACLAAAAVRGSPRCRWRARAGGAHRSVRQSHHQHSRQPAARRAGRAGDRWPPCPLRAHLRRRARAGSAGWQQRLRRNGASQRQCGGANR